MKRLLLIVSCALLCPMHLLDAAEEAAPAERVTRRATGRRTPVKKTTKTTAAKSKAAQPKEKRTQTTTAGKQTKTTQKKAAPKAKTTAARTKTTTAGKKTGTTKKSTKAATGARAKKTSYSTKPADKTKAKPAAHAKRVYRKGGVKHRRFEHLNNATAQKLGAVNKPVTQTISLNEPSRGYKNANHLTFTTPDGKTGQIVLDSHVLTAKRAEKKGIHKLSHVGQKSVEVYAGTDAPGKGLALIGEYPLLNANLKGTQDLQISVEPSGHVTLSGKNETGNFAPLTEFSIHQ